MSSSGLNEDIAQQEGEASLPNGEAIAGVNTSGVQAIPYYAGNAAQLQLERSYS